MSTPEIASWLLTYLIHSTVLLGAAWLTSRALGDRRMALQEVLLRTALIGGLLTSGLQLVLGLNPLAGSLSVGSGQSRLPVAETSIAVVVDEELPVARSFVPNYEASGGPFESTALAAPFVILWGFGSLVALCALGRSIQDLRRLLRTRQIKPSGRILERLASAMGLRRPIRLSTSKAVPVPFATGIRHPEICCPERVDDLAVEHQTGLFAHELAHLARRDPAWQLLYRIGEALLVLQPLNRVIRRRLEEIAEHLTDERAVACTGNRLGLARCLVVVAHWGHSSRIGVPAAAFASGPRLDRRVRRLLDDVAVEKTAPVWAAPLAASLLLVASLTLPFVAAGSADAGAFTDHPEVAVEKTWSDADDAPPNPPTPPTVPKVEPIHGVPTVPQAPPAVTVSAETPPTPQTPPEPDSAPEQTPPKELDIAPEADIKPEPAVAPEPVMAPEPSVLPEPAAAPEPVLAPEPDVTPAPTAPEAAPADRAARRAEEREREEYERRANQASESRARAEERAREHGERSQAKAHREAERVREMESRREEFAARSAEMRAAYEARSRERSLEAEERTRELSARKMTEQHRAELRQAREAEAELRVSQQRFELEKEAQQRALEQMHRAQKRAEERALVLEERARRFAEESEAERKAAEELKRREAEERE